MIGLSQILRDPKLVALLEADLQEFYHTDLLDFWRGALTLRKLLVFFNAILRKRESALAQELAGEEGRWDQQTHLLADLVDLNSRMVWLHYMNTAAQGIKPKDLQRPPELLPRPGKKKKIRFGSAQEARAAMLKG